MLSMTLINSYLNTIDLNANYTECTSDDEYYNAFKGAIDSVITNFVPLTSTSSRNCVPWFNDKLKHLKTVKQWQRSIRQKNIVKYSNYKKSQTLFKSKLFKARCDYENKLFDNRKKNSKIYYHCIRRQTTVCSAISCV